jgi:hypothetical protein
MKNGEKSKAVRMVDDALERLGGIVRVHNTTAADDASDTPGAAAIHGGITILQKKLMESNPGGFVGAGRSRMHTAHQTRWGEKRRQGHPDPSPADRSAQEEDCDHVDD